MAPLVWGRVQDFAVNSMFGISRSARSLPQRLPEATKRLEKIVANGEGRRSPRLRARADTVGMVEAAVGAQVEPISRVAAVAAALGAAENQLIIGARA